MFKSFKLKKCVSWVAAFALMIAMLPASAVSVKAAETSTTLQILATSDTHGKFVPYDYSTNSEDNSGSLAQLDTAVKELRSKNPDNTILVDDGDIIQDNSESLFLNEKNPMILAMNQMGYSTITLGNHEFNFGMDTLKKVMGSAKATILCGNVYDKDGKRVYAPYKIVTTKAGIKVGIIGMTTPNITRWDSVNLKDYKVTNPVEETKKIIPQIKDKVDIMIAVVHMGEDPEYNEPGSGAKELADACPELTAIVAGHAHASVKGDTENGVLIVEPTNAGKQLAKIDITLSKQNGKYKVNKKASELKDMKDYKADADLLKILAPYDKTAKDDANTVVGKLQGGDLVKADEIEGIPTSQIECTPMIDLINKVQMYYGQKISKDNKPVDVAAAAAFNSYANIKEGSIKKADTALIYKYDNTLWVFEVTGKQLKKYMEWSASYYNTYKDGDLTLSFSPDIRGYNYDMFTGVKYDVDVSKAPGSRIVNLTKMDGTAIKDTDTLRLAVNNYRGQTQLTKAGTVYEEGEELPKVLYKSEDTMGDSGRLRDLIRDYIVNVKGGTITPLSDNNWKVIGNNWNKDYRASAVKFINAGKIAIPVSKDGRTPNVAPVTKTMVDAAKAAADMSNKVTILSFNDFHGSVAQSGKNVGMVKFAGAVDAYKSENPDTIVVSGGDNFQGSSISNLTYGAPVNEFMKSIGVTASAVGNHEFDWGTDRIPNWAKDGGYDYLACNIYDKATGEPVTWAKPYKIVSAKGIKIAFIGFTTPETSFKTTPANVKNLEFKDPKSVAGEWIEKAKKDGADVVIALTHLGSVQDAKTGAITGEAADLCSVKGFDAVISAHTHNPVSGKVNGVPVVQGYYNGRDIAVLTITLDKDKKVQSIETSLDKLYEKQDKLADDANVKGIYDKYNTKLQPILDEVVGKTSMELSHDRFKYAGTSPLGYWVCDIMRKNAKTQIGITNGGGLRCPIPKGDINMGKLYEVMPFDNTLYTMELKGSDLKRVIENGIMNDTIGWVQAAGIKVNYDAKKPAGSRIISMKLENGTKIDMNKYYTVVTNDFMATGGDNYNFAGAKNMKDTNVPIRNAMVDALKALNGKALNFVFDEPLVSGSSAASSKTAAQTKLVEKVKAASSKTAAAATEYVVKAGDCLWVIGQKFNTTYKKIAEYNKIENPDIIFIGQKLLIPVPAK